MGFREKAYRSTLTNILAPEFPELWLDILDDSLEHFSNLTLVKSNNKKIASSINRCFLLSAPLNVAETGRRPA